MADAKFSLRLILKFDSSTSVVDWVKRMALTCCLCGIKQVEPVIHLQLTGDTLDIYQQLSNNEKSDVGVTKAVLYKAFVMNPCTAYKCFTTQTLMAYKTVDVFFVALKKLVDLFGGYPEGIFVYAFVARLPARVKQLLRLSTSIEATLIEQLLECAQVIVRNEAELGEPVVMVMQMAQSDHTTPPRLNLQARVNCFHCGQIDHITKGCTDKRCGCVC